MESFNQWMDAQNMTPDEASEVFSKSPGTIRNWRSLGVPESQREWVAKRIGEREAAKIAASLNRVILDITGEQLDAWSAAAIDARLILRDWASQALDEAAAADSTGSPETPNPLQSVPMAAEPSDPGDAYRTKKDGAA